MKQDQATHAELFKGKVAIVTGAAQGLGLAYVQALLDRGAYVVSSDLVRTEAAQGRTKT